MAKKNFGKLDKTFDKVAERSAINANVYTLRNITNADLIDYPKNQEDIEDTADIENSIKELGVFSDPIEVTDFNMPDGKFIIVSGHRRRVAGVKCGIDIFPCLVRQFESEAEVQNYVLLANSHRDSSKDPLLMPKRIKMHEEYLKSIKFKGSKREEIAKRLGISASQVDRYNDMNSIILPVWDMVRDEIVYITSVSPLASRTHEQQEEIYLMMKECLESGGDLNRRTMKTIVDAYTDGKRTYQEIISGSSESNEDKGNLEYGLLNDNQEKDIEPVKKDISDRADKKITSIDENRNYNSRKTEDNNSIKIGQGQEIITHLENFNSSLNANSSNRSKEDAELIINRFEKTFENVIKKMQIISKLNNLDDVYGKFLENIIKKCTTQINNR